MADKNTFEIECPFCGKVNSFTGDNWRDELIDDNDTTNIECMYCDFPMEITTHAEYTLTVEPYNHNNN